MCSSLTSTPETCQISAIMHDQLDLEGEVFRLYQCAGIGVVRIFSKSPKPQLAAMAGCEVWKG